MRMRPNPVREVLHDALGMDTFALDGDETPVMEGWDEKPRYPRGPVRRY